MVFVATAEDVPVPPKSWSVVQMKCAPKKPALFHFFHSPSPSESATRTYVAAAVVAIVGVTHVLGVGTGTRSHTVWLRAHPPKRAHNRHTHSSISANTHRQKTDGRAQVGSHAGAPIQAQACTRTHTHTHTHISLMRPFTHSRNRRTQTHTHTHAQQTPHSPVDMSMTTNLPGGVASTKALMNEPCCCDDHLPAAAAAAAAAQQQERQRRQ